MNSLISHFCLTDARIPEAARSELTHLGYEVLLLPPLGSLPPPVSGHTDLLCFPLGSHLLTRACYAAMHPEIFDRLSGAGTEILLSPDPGGSIYPADTGFCACVTGNTLVCREASTDPALLRLARESGLSVLSVRQGYAKCSVLPLPDGAAVTSDPGIAAALRRLGHEVLTVAPGHVTLPGYDTGFIGGCAGIAHTTHGDVLYFVGDPAAHPDGEAIAAFCARHAVRTAPLCSGNLFDIGSLFFLP